MSIDAEKLWEGHEIHKITLPRPLDLHRLWKRTHFCWMANRFLSPLNYSHNVKLEIRSVLRWVSSKFLSIQPPYSTILALQSSPWHSCKTSKRQGKCSGFPHWILTWWSLPHAPLQQRYDISFITTPEKTKISITVISSIWLIKIIQEEHNLCIN